MDDKQTPTENTPEPQKNSQPSSTPGNSDASQPQAATPAQPVPTAAPQPAPAAQVPGAHGNIQQSKTGLIAGIAGAVVVVILAILALGWFMFWSPAAQSKRLSNSFMHSIAAGDVDKAVKLADDPE